MIASVIQKFSAIFKVCLQYICDSVPCSFIWQKIIFSKTKVQTEKNIRISGEMDKSPLLFNQLLGLSGMSLKEQVQLSFLLQMKFSTKKRPSQFPILWNSLKVCNSTNNWYSRQCEYTRYRSDVMVEYFIIAIYRCRRFDIFHLKQFPACCLTVSQGTRSPRPRPNLCDNFNFFFIITYCIYSPCTWCITESSGCCLAVSGKFLILICIFFQQNNNL